jgi:hypothetical protein
LVLPNEVVDEIVALICFVNVLICSTVFLILLDNFSISLATILKPLPASLALAASIEAFKLSNFVLLEISFISDNKDSISLANLLTLLISKFNCSCVFNTFTDAVAIVFEVRIYFQYEYLILGLHF